ncbi:MAG: hypothetical protein U0903_06915 [Planctomycetales bacterium]
MQRFKSWFLGLALSASLVGGTSSSLYSQTEDPSSFDQALQGVPAMDQQIPTYTEAPPAMQPVLFENLSLDSLAPENLAAPLIINDKLLGLFAASDDCFSDFIAPLSNPLYFENPRTVTEARLIFANHWFNDANPVFQGGTAQYLAMQVRAALTERLSIIATKDGYIWMNPTNGALGDPDGWANIAAGLKYNLIRDPDAQRIVSVGTTFEIPAGTKKVFQGNGSGEFHLFLTGGQQIGERWHYMTASGFRLPSDFAAQSQSWYWSNHVDYALTDRLYGLVELNWFHWTGSGKTLPVNFEGVDLVNLGSTSVAGNDVVTIAFGGRRKLFCASEVGAGYEVPVSPRKDIFGSRLYLDLILRY